MKKEYEISIPTSNEGISSLLKHLISSRDVKILNWEEIVFIYDRGTNKAINGFKITLVYKGTKAFWLRHLKPRARILGLNIKEV